MAEIPLTIINIEASHEATLAELMAQSFELYEKEALKWRPADEQYRRRELGYKDPTQPLPAQAEETLEIDKAIFRKDNNRVTTALGIVDRAIRVGREVSRVMPLADKPDLKLRRHVPIVDETPTSFVIQPFNLIYAVDISKMRQSGYRYGSIDLRYRFEFHNSGFAYQHHPVLPDEIGGDWDNHEYELKELSPLERLGLYMGSVCSLAYIEDIAEASHRTSKTPVLQHQENPAI